MSVSQNCEECSHAKMCSMANNMNGFLESFKNFWTIIPTTTPVPHPVGKDMGRVLAIHCRFFEEKHGPILAKEN